MVTFEEIAYELSSLHSKKNADYGNTFSDLFDEHGMVYSIIHLEEKLNRIKSVYRNNRNEVECESVEDSLKDLASYAIMTLVSLNNKYKNGCTD